MSPHRFQVVLPSAVPGILAGIILAVGRIVGETAALMYTAGTVAGIPSNLFGSGRTLAVHMYVLTNEDFIPTSPTPPQLSCW